MAAVITSALIAAGVAASTAATIASIVVFAAKALFSYAVASLLAPKSKGAAGSAINNAQTLSTIDPTGNWQIVYGRVRKGGTYVFRHVTSVIDVESLEEVHVIPQSAPHSLYVGRHSTYVSTSSVNLVINGVEQDTYIPMTQVASSPAAGEYSVTAGQYTFNAEDAGKNVQIFFTSRSGPVSNKILHLVLVLASHEVESIDEVWFNDEIVTIGANDHGTGKWSAAYVKKYLGSPTDQADPVLMSEAPAWWTAEHRLRGHAYLYVRLSKPKDSTIWQNGVPNITVVMKGKKDIYDPRSDTRGYTDNAALIVNDYLTHPLGLNAVYADAINAPALIAAANICDEAVALAGGGTEKRYTINGVADTGEQPGENVARMIAAMAGRLVYVGGEWNIHAGAYQAPSVTLTESDFAGPVEVTTRLSSDEIFNGVKGVFASPANNWQPADFPVVKSDTYMAEDGGRRIWKDIELPYTASPSMAQRIAKIDLLRARQQITAAMALKMTAYKIQPPDVVNLTLPKFGWSGKPFEVGEMSVNFAEAPTIELKVRETSATVYDWSTDEESPIDPAPNTSLGSPFVVQTPGSPLVSESIFESFGFGLRVRADVTWGDAPDSSVSWYDLQYKKVSDALWSEVPGLTVPRAQLMDVEAGKYQFRVRAVNFLGRNSLWAQSEHTFYGLTAPPSNVTGFSVIKSAGFALAQWDQAADLDVQLGGHIVVRHSLKTTGAVWEDGFVLDTFPGNTVSGLVPLVSGTYMAKWRDSSASFSPAMSAYVVTEGMVTGFTTVASSVQAPGFTGAKTGITLDGGVGGIRLTTVPSTGEYAFDTHMDLTTVATRRIEADIEVLCYDVGTLFDSRSGAVDEWPDWDGVTNINDCDATLFVRVTNDNPAGSPTWGPWTPFVVADFTCRALQFKVVMSSAAAQYNIVIKTLTVHAKVPT